jgi:hypothetical protein
MKVRVLVLVLLGLLALGLVTGCSRTIRQTNPSPPTTLSGNSNLVNGADALDLELQDLGKSMDQNNPSQIIPDPGK